MSHYIFTIARNSGGHHAVAREQAERVLKCFIAAHHPFIYREKVNADDNVEYLIYEPEGAEFGKILVNINSVIFMAYGPLAEAEAWNTEAEITDLMDGEFQTGKVSVSG